MNESSVPSGIIISNNDFAENLFKKYKEYCISKERAKGVKDFEITTFKEMIKALDEFIINDTDMEFYRTISWQPDDDSAFIPNPKYCKAGRANKEGEAFLYLASNVFTSIKESKKDIKDKAVKLSSFIPKRKLKLLDFATNRNVESSKTNSFRFIFDKEFSKPTTVEDKLDDYLPTQCLATYIKDELNYDGIKYSSSFEECHGYNIVLFNINSFELKEWDFAEKFIKNHKL